MFCGWLSIHVQHIIPKEKLWPLLAKVPLGWVGQFGLFLVCFSHWIHIKECSLRIWSHSAWKGVVYLSYQYLGKFSKLYYNVMNALELPLTSSIIHTIYHNSTNFNHETFKIDSLFTQKLVWLNKKKREIRTHT